MGEVDAFLEFSTFFYDPMDAGNLISGSAAFSKSRLNIWNFSIHILLKPTFKDFDPDAQKIEDRRGWAKQALESLQGLRDLT